MNFFESYDEKGSSSEEEVVIIDDDHPSCSEVENILDKIADKTTRYSKKLDDWREIRNLNTLERSNLAKKSIKLQHGQWEEPLTEELSKSTKGPLYDLNPSTKGSFDLNPNNTLNIVEKQAFGSNRAVESRTGSTKPLKPSLIDDNLKQSYIPDSPVRTSNDSQLAMPIPRYSNVNRPKFYNEESASSPKQKTPPRLFSPRTSSPSIKQQSAMNSAPRKNSGTRFPTPTISETSQPRIPTPTISESSKIAVPTVNNNIIETDAAGLRVSRFRNIIDKAAKEQEAAQKLFQVLQKDVVIDLPPEHFSFMDPNLSVPNSDDEDDILEFHIPPPPNQPPPRQLLGEKKNSKLETTRRLQSLGIFDIQPLPKITNPTTSLPRVQVNSFVTPSHTKAEKVKKIDKITSPKLIATSSNVRIIPIQDILSDLRISGRLYDQDANTKQ